MIYKDFKGTKISELAMGCMRLPVIDGRDESVDQKLTDEMVDYALKNGVNYFDTAWGYHNGNSELAIGKSLSRFPRESFMLATKFPGYDLSNISKVEEIFTKQLKKCQTEYFDFYLFHNVCEMNIDEYLNPKNGILDYLLKQKENGRIRHLGFSAHGSIETIERFLHAYGSEMEFCQLQINYLDWSFQDAKRKFELVQKHSLPVWVMEPLRGGRLSKLTESEEKMLKELRPDETIPAWAFRFLQSVPGVTTVLSGMSDFSQLKENIETFESEKPLTDEEMSVLLSLADEMTAKKILPCTACRYCTSHCPQELDIPELLALYNEHKFTEGGFLAPMRMLSLPNEKKPNACIGCRSCEAVCPQQIKISEAMSDFAEKLGM